MSKSDESGAEVKGPTKVPLDHDYVDDGPLTGEIAAMGYLPVKLDRFVDFMDKSDHVNQRAGFQDALRRRRQK
jgi:hypothetical protein